MIQKKLIEKFNTLFRSNKDINSTILIGSFGRGTPKANSDIDYQILVNTRFNHEKFLDEIQKVFSNELRHHIFLKQKNKWCFYLTDNYLVTEVFVCCDLSQLDKYFLGSEIDKLSEAIVFDRTEILEQYLLQAIEEKKNEFEVIQKDKVEAIVIDFQNRFESCSDAHSKSDGYKFYVLYSHALNLVVKMVYLCERRVEYDYMPPNFLTDFSYKLELGIEKLGTMDLRFANSHKRELLNIFEKYLPIIVKEFNLEIQVSPVTDFLESIFMRDYFWNFRDISRFNPKIRKGFIYRSSALCLYKDEPSLETKLKTHGITTIIDLRASKELKAIYYDSKQKEKYNIIHAPFDPWSQSVEFQNTHNTGTNAEIAYYFFSTECKSSIKILIEEIIHSKGAINIHCYAGKDRTGIVITVLHLLSGADKEIVLFDYLASEMDTRKYYIQIFLNEVDKKGGIVDYLIDCGVNESNIQKLKEMLFYGD